jgi:hypothetical protein
MDSTPQRLTGAVIRKAVAKGSKSEHEAVVLRTAEGSEYWLRRAGGNAFRDPELDRLVGSSITADGRVAGQTFIMKRWQVERAAKG